MALTVGGFAQARSGILQGKGGNRGRRDNGVSPLPPAIDDAATDAVIEAATDTAEWSVALPEPATRPARRPARTRTARPGTRRGSWRASKALPAALEWRDARLPLLGRLWARAWLPSILLAGCLMALVYLLQTSGVATTGYDIQRLQSERDDWQLRNEQLQLELAKRQSLTWIESEATGRMGMVRAEPTALVYVRASR